MADVVMSTMENKKKNNSWKILIGILAVAAVVALLLVVYNKFAQKPMEGSKAITIEVVNKAQETTTYEVKTDAEFLRQAMDEAGITYDIDDGMINNVNGEIADFDADGAYWSITVNGEYGMNGVETQPVIDGDIYAIIYTVFVAE